MVEVAGDARESIGRALPGENRHHTAGKKTEIELAGAARWVKIRLRDQLPSRFGKFTTGTDDVTQGGLNGGLRAERFIFLQNLECNGPPGGFLRGDGVAYYACAAKGLSRSRILAHKLQRIAKAGFGPRTGSNMSLMAVLFSRSSLVRAVSIPARRASGSVLPNRLRTADSVCLEAGSTGIDR